MEPIGLSFKGCNMKVTVEGKGVNHYGVTVDEEAKHINCWIPSENDKVNFAAMSLTRLGK